MYLVNDFISRNPVTFLCRIQYIHIQNIQESSKLVQCHGIVFNPRNKM